MQETIQQYIDRINGYMEGQRPMEVQAETSAALERLLKGAPVAKLNQPPAPGKWSVAQILAHLADGEIVIGWRLRQMLASPGCHIASFDQDAWAAAGIYDGRDPQESLEQFRVLRGMNLALLRSLTPVQWQFHGMHSERGRETVQQVATMVAGHDLNHLQQIQRILAPQAGKTQSPAA